MRTEKTRRRAGTGGESARRWLPLVLLFAGCMYEQRGCSGEGEWCELDDDCEHGFVCVPFGEWSGSVCQLACGPFPRGQACAPDRVCCGPEDVPFCGTAYACAGIVLCEEGSGCAFEEGDCSSQTYPGLCERGAAWAEERPDQSCRSHGGCAQDLAYCRTGEGCRSVYAADGSWCDLAERAYARHAEGPLLFEPRLADGDTAPDCAPGEDPYWLQLQTWDAERDFEGEVRVIASDGSIRPLHRAPISDGWGPISISVCVPGGDETSLGFVAVDAQGHRSNPLCVSSRLFHPPGIGD